MDVLIHRYQNALTCCSQPSSVSGNVVGKDDGPHAGLARATLAHQQHLKQQNGPQVSASSQPKRLDIGNLAVHKNNDWVCGITAHCFVWTVYWHLQSFNPSLVNRSHFGPNTCSCQIIPASYHFCTLLVCVILRLATSRKYCK